MRVFLGVAAVGFGLCFSSASYGTPETEEATDADQKVICEHKRQTGTRFTKKICRTATQWEKMSEAHQAGMKEMVDRPQIKICDPSGCD